MLIMLLLTKLGYSHWVFQEEENVNFPTQVVLYYEIMFSLGKL